MSEEELDDRLVNLVLDYDGLLNQLGNLQYKISTHLQLSINKLLEYGDKHHYQIANRSFLESVVKEDGEGWLEYDKITDAINKARINLSETAEEYQNQKKLIHDRR